MIPVIQGHISSPQLWEGPGEDNGPATGSKNISFVVEKVIWFPKWLVYRRGLNACEKLSCMLY